MAEIAGWKYGKEEVNQVAGMLAAMVDSLPGVNNFSLFVPLDRPTIQVTVQRIDGITPAERITDLMGLLEDIRNGYPDIEDWPAWKEVIGSGE